jgi:hypothetical protein
MLKKFYDKIKLSIHEYVKLRNKRNGSYIWVGDGENPFR